MKEVLGLYLCTLLRGTTLLRRTTQDALTGSFFFGISALRRGSLTAHGLHVMGSYQFAAVSVLVRILFERSSLFTEDLGVPTCCAYVIRRSKHCLDGGSRPSAPVKTSPATLWFK